MIQLNCTNCKSLLEIDDAFAGGVCRCRYCGTIQTVPKRLKESAQESNGDAVLSQVAAQVKSPKTLFQKKAEALRTGEVGSGSGLDDLAEIVASSGLSSRRLRNGAARPQEIPPAANKNTVMIVAVAGAIIALLLGVIIFMAVRDKTGGDPTPGNTVAATNDARATPAPTSDKLNQPNDTVKPIKTTVTVPKTSGPAFMGQALDYKSVVYVIDRGAATQSEGRLDALRNIVTQSIKSLGPDRKFQVVFWQSDGPPESFPSDGLSSATPDQIAQCWNFMETISPKGQTKLAASLDKAMKVRPEAVVLVPVKSFLEENFLSQVIKLRGNQATRFFCFSLGQPELGEVLTKVGNETGGSYRDIPLGELRAAGGE